MKSVLQTSHNHVLYKGLGVKVGVSFTFLRRLCMNVRKTWDTTKPIPTTSRRAEMIPTAGITHDLRVMFACAGYTEIRPRDTRGWMETSVSGRSASFTSQLHDRLISELTACYIQVPTFLPPRCFFCFVEKFLQGLTVPADEQLSNGRRC